MDGHLPQAQGGPATTARVSQRQPRACQECTKRKMRCDKRNPCGRCVRLSRPCSRELVRISKAETVNRDELQFLTQFCQDLTSHRDVDTALAALQQRMTFLLHGPDHQSSTSGPSSAVEASPAHSEHDQDGFRVSTAEGYPDNASVRPERRLLTPFETPGSNSSNGDVVSPAANFQKVEFLAWGRHSVSCFPHVKCLCREVRAYAEIASINADLEWAGLRRTPAVLPSGVCLPAVDEARKLVQFHFDNILWHHNVFHASVFLAQCEEFWLANTVVHPLWLSLYIAVLLVSAWTALNSGSLWLGTELSPSMPLQLFEAMVQILYRENFCHNQSIFSIQAIVLCTRVAHNLDQGNLNATLVGAAIRMAHILGLHKITGEEPRTSVNTPGAWFAAIETEVGRRCWNQLVIQDYFQVFFTETYAIHPSHYTTDLPTNCHDEDMVTREEATPTINSYPRTLSRIASLMPRLLDGLGSAKVPTSFDAVINHVMASDQALRDVIRDIPSFFLAASQTAEDSDSPAWLPTARRSLALSAADKIIMIHRPILYHSFHTTALARTRKTCVAAAMTIFREFESISDENGVPIWTHSAFCITAAMVVGLELLFCGNHMGDESRRLRAVMAATAKRLRSRKSDTIAERCAALIDTVLGAEEELVVKTMRLSSEGDPSVGASQEELVRNMIGGNEIMAKFLALSPIVNRDFGADAGGFYTEEATSGVPDWFGSDDLGLFAGADTDPWFFGVT